jgi:Flp pilus assembly protein TadD
VVHARSRIAGGDCRTGFVSETMIQGETPRAMNAAQECAVLRATVCDGTAPSKVRSRLALLLNQLDAFAETIDLLGSADALDHHEQMLLVAACFARNEGGDTARALDAARAALTLADDDRERAAALADQAKALLRLDQQEAARALLREALALDPCNAEACKRLTVDLLLGGEAAAALAVTDRLAALGIAHARLFEARATALAMVGEHAAARDTLRLDAFLHQDVIAAPDGWDSLSAFNAALADELLAHPAIRYERHGTASVESWRIDTLAAGDGPLARLLVDRIVAGAQRHADALAGTDHPWVAAAPRQAVMRSWCVITEGSGYERWHMHPFGWMSGVYYVDVPDPVSTGSDRDGCLMLGLSDRVLSEETAAAVGHHMVRPRPGLLALFPSHAYHRTFPHRATGKRICVAFDIDPG